jgi:single-strand DNA-binding protein
MAYVRVEQRNARLAAGVRLDTVQGKDGPIVKGTAVAISNIRRGSGGEREEEATSIQWTFWGKLAETAAEYLGKGSRVNVVGRVQNNNYEKAPGELIYGLTFTCEEIDFLDTRAEVEARRARYDAGQAPHTPATAPVPSKGNTRDRLPAKSNRSARPPKAVDPDDIPF